MKWFDLKEIVNQKPRFIALVEQNLKKDGNFEDYKFVYSSKHNFFKMITKEIDKKKTLIGNVSIFNKRISIPEEINDKDISENEFIETVLDHCKYSPVKNIKDPDTKKKILFKKFDTCKIKYINTKKLDDMTLEKIVKLEKKNEIEIKADIEKKDKVSKKQEKDKKMLIVKQPEVKSSSKDNIGVSFRWQKFPYPIFSNLKMNNKVSGILNFFIYETKDECVGTIALNSNNKGNWSLSCPDNKKRSGVFKKGLGASGSIVVENNVIIGTGYDTYRNEVKFVAK